MLTNQVIQNMLNEDYHADKISISRSGLMDFDRSPYTYWAKHLNPNRPKPEPTSSMILGSAFHTLILEPELFDKNYAVKPKPMLLKNVGRDQYDRYKGVLEYLENSGSIILTEEQWQILMDMEMKLEDNFQATSLIKDARIEHSFFWQDPHSELYLKCRPDALQDNIIVDLKTANDASPRAFQNAIITGGYHLQFAMMRDAIEILEGRRITNFVNIVCETKYPYNMGIYIMDEDAVNQGQLKYKQICLDLKAALAENKWSDYGVQTLGLPKWAI